MGRIKTTLKEMIYKPIKKREMKRRDKNAQYSTNTNRRMDDSMGGGNSVAQVRNTSRRIDDHA